jgi:hypothetical protein
MAGRVAFEVTRSGVRRKGGHLSPLGRAWVGVDRISDVRLLKSASVFYFSANPNRSRSCRSFGQCSSGTSVNLTIGRSNILTLQHCALPLRMGGAFEPALSPMFLLRPVRCVHCCWHHYVNALRQVRERQPERSHSGQIVASVSPARFVGARWAIPAESHRRIAPDARMANQTELRCQSRQKQELLEN